MKAVAAVIGAFLLAGIVAGYFVARIDRTDQPERTEAEIAQIEAEVEEAAQAWIEAWGSQDCEAVARLWHPEYQTQPRQGFLIKTRDQRIEACREGRAIRDSFDGRWIETDVRVVSPNAAVFAGIFEGTFRYRDGTPPRYYAHSAQVILFERMESGWGLSFASTANDAPQPVGEEG